MTGDQDLEHELGKALEGERRAVAEAAVAVHRARFLSEASWLLGESLDVERILDRVAHLCMPAIADWCSFHLLDTERQIRMVAVAASDPDRDAWARGFVGERHFVQNADAIAEVIANQRSVLLATDPGPLIDNAVPPAWRGDVEAHLPVRSIICAPLAARGCCFGALLLARFDPSSPFGAADQLLAEELAIRSAVAVDNATLYEQANQAIRAREEFISVASHELRTPLAVLTLLVDRQLSMIARRRDVPLEEIADALTNMKRQFRGLSELVESLLDVRHISDVRSSLSLQDTDLAMVAREVIERLLITADRAGCPLVVRGLAEPIYGRWDPLRIDQILTNLLTNALKYGRGKPVELTLEADESVARMIVRDYGIGITPSDRERIFARFERAVPASHYGGLGLGLFIAQQLAAAHGGEIRVESQPDEGATFIVELPRWQASDVG